MAGQFAGLGISLGLIGPRHSNRKAVSQPLLYLRGRIWGCCTQRAGAATRTRGLFTRPVVSDGMRVGLGSQNPVKLSATERGFDAFEEPASIEAIDVDSGVSAQPLGDSETIRGAKIRAERALGDHDYGVGIEGGVADGPDDSLLMMWAAVTDGDDMCLGGGPRLPLPQGVAERVWGGEELGPVMDDLFGLSNVAQKQGAVGVLTSGIVDRETALLHALAGAIGPFVTGHYARNSTDL